MVTNNTEQPKGKCHGVRAASNRMVGLGDTTKKLQKLADTAEELFEKLNELRTQVAETRERVDDTHAKAASLEREQAKQRALLEAIATQQGVDVDAVLTEAAIEEAEPADGDAPDDR